MLGFSFPGLLRVYNVYDAFSGKLSQNEKQLLAEDKL